jgi:hypothetical protein
MRQHALAAFRQAAGVSPCETAAAIDQIDAGAYALIGSTSRGLQSISSGGVPSSA